MPNIKSAIKRVKTSKAKTSRNIMKKSALKTALKKCKTVIAEKSSSAAETLNDTIKTIDKAAANKIIHKNTAARRKSRLAKALNAVNK